MPLGEEIGTRHFRPAKKPRRGEAVHRRTLIGGRQTTGERMKVGDEAGERGGKTRSGNFGEGPAEKGRGLLPSEREGGDDRINSARDNKTPGRVRGARAECEKKNARWEI